MSTDRSDPTALRELFRTRLRQELHTGSALPRDVPAVRRGYREAACLLTSFDPAELRLPGEERAGGRAVMELMDDCTAVGTGDHTEWTLIPPVREEALRSLAGPEAARLALESNLDQFPDEPGPEHICLALLSGGPVPEPAHVTPDQLADILQAVLWLSHVPGVQGLPDAGELRHRLEFARLLQPVERLVRHPLVGRDRELAELDRRVDLHGTGPAPPHVLLHGPGGMGKSTLLATYLLSAVRDNPGMPFAYIDCERPTLSVHEPVTVVAEVARQLSVQYPAYRAEFEALAEECQRTALDQRVDWDEVTELNRLATTRVELGRRSSQQFQIMATACETELFQRVAQVLRRAVAPGEPPFLLVADAVDAAQFRGSRSLGRLWAMLMTLRAAYPRLRVVASGRSHVPHPAAPMRPQEIELTDLGADASVAVLEAGGVQDPEVARALADRVGGHPLSLRLAARAAGLAHGDTALMASLIESLPPRREDQFRRVDQMLVQGTLYEWILRHLADADVRGLALAGLVLRLITPELIQEVMAEPCGVPVDGPEEARRLFDGLARLDLMEPAGPDAVRHRADVRAIMLRLADDGRAGLTARVEERAVAYYAARDGVEARAEEIYHRLRRNENPRAVEERWLPGVERFLAGAQREMGPRAAGLLSAHLGGGVPDAVLAEADQEDWERIRAREVDDLLAQGYANEALARLGERRPWTPCSPLHSLLAETLNRLGRRAEARATVADAIGPARAAACGERLLELLLASADLARDDGDTAHAEEALREAEDVAVALDQDLEAMGALLARARLAAQAAVPDRDADTRLARRLRGLPDAVLADQPAFVRAVASQVYDRDPQMLDHILEVVGLPDDDEAPAALGEALRRAVRKQPGLLWPLMEALGETAGGPSAEGGAGPSAEGGAGSERPAAGRAGSGARPGTGAGTGTGTGAGAGTAGRAGSGARAGPAPSDITGILRLARDRGTLDELARRLLGLPDESGEIAAGVAAALRAGSGATAPGTRRVSGASGTGERSGPEGPGRR
ncbi:AAA family ATPase [Streptomyces sp. NPDC047928]|uniref:AAA family ATPase n=1 Tax=unclassified Streptomyces TaxID=2593676 RepID=UPI00370FF2B6